jgi:hypothetical protein
MSKDKEKIVEVNINNNKLKIIVKKPNNVVLSQAQRVGAKAWTDCVRDGIMTKKELEKFMKEQGIWDDGKDKEQKNLIDEISSLEKSLYIGSQGHAQLKASDGKEIAIKMRVKRAELRDLIAERISLEQNTAESISDNARFDYLVANCAFYENGQKVYNSLEEYQSKADVEPAFTAATTLAAMLYSVDRDFEAKLPENKFLKMFNFVNDDLSLVNKEGETVDLDGRRIDKNGFYINNEGKRVDRDGNLLDEFGNYVPTVEYVSDDSLEEDKKEKRKKKTTDS